METLTLKELTIENLTELMNLQEALFENDDNCKEWLRYNDESVFAEILENPKHTAIGHFDNEELVSFGVLYNPELSQENINIHLTDNEEEILSSRNLKIVMSLPNFRRSGLAREIIQTLRLVAEEENASNICCTIHPMNAKSKTLFQSFNYEQKTKIETSYGFREVWKLTLTGV